MRTPHTACRRGKRVRVVLLDGEVFIDKFRENTGKFVHFESHPKVIKGQIKAFTIVKGNPQ